MKYRGKIDKINHIVLSDPSYLSGSNYRYEKDNLKLKDWNVYLDVDTLDDGEDISFVLILYENDGLINIKDGQMMFPERFYDNKCLLGMDTACIALGINDHAKEILNSSDEWQPPCAIRTGMDGIFGEVQEGVDGNKLKYIMVNGLVDVSLISEEEIFNYLVENFEIKDLNLEKESSKDEMEM